MEIGYALGPITYAYGSAAFYIVIHISYTYVHNWSYLWSCFIGQVAILSLHRRQYVKLAD